MGMDIGMGVRDGDKHTYAIAQAGTNSADELKLRSWAIYGQCVSGSPK